MTEKSARLKEVIKSFCKHTKNFDMGRIYLPFRATNTNQVVMHEKVNLDLSADFRNHPNLKRLTPAHHGVEVYQRLRTCSVERETKRVRRASQELSITQSKTKPTEKARPRAEDLRCKLNRILKQNDANLNELHYLYNSFDQNSIRNSPAPQTDISLVAPKTKLDLNSKTKLPVISINESVEKHRCNILPRKQNTDAKNFFLKRTIN